uniref:Uncharacterized protein n=1 Tax=Arundo donax TaxID=35708 RepID=A0A0A8ZC57_ARUDO
MSCRALFAVHRQLMESNLTGVEDTAGAADGSCRGNANGTVSSCA